MADTTENIRARHQARAACFAAHQLDADIDSGICPHTEPDQMDDDIGDLLAEVERLQKIGPALWKAAKRVGIDPRVFVQDAIPDLLAEEIERLRANTIAHSVVNGTLTVRCEACGDITAAGTCPHLEELLRRSGVPK